MAETSVCALFTNWTGNAPVCSTSARFSPSSSVTPVTSVPLSPLIPFGHWVKSIVGNDSISLSRTIAKLWK